MATGGPTSSQSRRTSMKCVIESVGSSTMISFKLSHNSKPARTYLRRKLTQDEAKHLSCLVQSLSGLNMNCCLLSLTEPSQLCLGPEFCPLLHPKSLDKPSISNTSQCLLPLKWPALLQELNEPCRSQEGSLGSIPL